jgi:hypothetical protein
MAFGALRTEISADDPFRNLYDSFDASLLSASECEELLTRLMVDTERLVKNIEPIQLINMAESLLFTAPRCFWCYRTEAHLDINTPQLISCGVCIGATYCSGDHRDKGETTHKATATEYGRTEVCYPVFNPAGVLTFFGN